MQSLMSIEKDETSPDVTTADVEAVLRQMWIHNQSYIIAAEVCVCVIVVVILFEGAANFTAII
jgi:hypothetical protein